MAIADRVTVLRDGRLIGTKATSELTRDEIVHMMVGRPLRQMYVRSRKPSSEVVLEVET